MIGDIQPCLLITHSPQNDHPDHAHSFLLTLAALELNAQAGKKIPAFFIHDVEFGLQQESLWTSQAIAPRTYPLHTPDFIVNISATHQIAQRALHTHKTQMYDPVRGQPKAYADLIDTLAQIRGLQFMTKGARQIPRGQGFSPVVIPGVTNEQNTLSLLLPAKSVYKRVKKR